MPSEYYDDYCSYLSLLNRWINQGIEPDDSVPQAYTATIPYNEFDERIPYAKYYWGSKSIRRRLIEEKWKPLNELAEIVQSDWVDNTTMENPPICWFDTSKDLSYPYIPERYTTTYIRKTTVVLKKWDILWNGDKKFFLIDKDTQDDIYVPAGWRVIRTKEISPEYMYFYLSSDFAKTLIDRLTIRLLDMADFNPCVMKRI